MEDPPDSSAPLFFISRWLELPAIMR
ncbi:hypothetical protein CCACVL1_17475, partial [Corchorus capsularis]